MPSRVIKSPTTLGSPGKEDNQQDTYGGSLVFRKASVRRKYTPISHSGKSVSENCFAVEKQTKMPCGKKKRLSISYLRTKCAFKEAKLLELCCILKENIMTHGDIHPNRISQPVVEIEEGTPRNEFWELLVQPYANHFTDVLAG